MARRTPQRLTQRNGYRDQICETRTGAVELRIPKLSKGSYFPGFLEPRRMAEKAPPWCRKTMCTCVSTSSVDDLVQAMGMTGISNSQVSRLCGEIDDKANAFLGRPTCRICGSTLREGAPEWPHRIYRRGRRGRRQC